MGTGSYNNTLSYSLGPNATPAQRAKAQRDFGLDEASLLGKDTKMPPPPPDLTDELLRDAQSNALKRLRMGRGRNSTFLTAGSIGDTTTLLGG